MPEATNLSALPEAIPLRSVSPLWRVLAILAIIASAVLLGLVAVLSVAMMSDSSSFTQVGSSLSPVPPGFINNGVVIPLDGPFALPPVEEEGQDPRNAPYPLRANLAEAERTTSRPPRLTAARRFLQLGQDVWLGHKELQPEFLTVSPDGQYLATVHGGRLLAGTVAQGPMFALGADEGAPSGDMPQFGGPPGPGGGSASAQPFEMLRGEPFARRPVIGVPTWARDHPVVSIAIDGGRMRSYRFEVGSISHAAESLPFSGEALAVVPGITSSFVIVRSRAVAKLDTPGESTADDPTEVVLYGLDKKSERILIAAGRAAWKYPTISPDGARLAIVSERGHEDKARARWRVFVHDLSGGEPRPVTPGAPALGPVCWTPDGRGLIYARVQPSVPADHLEEDPTARGANSDLVHLDLASGKETRLTRGGGFFSPSVDNNDNLYYLTSRGEGAASLVTLRRMPLQTALAFAATEPEQGPLTAEAWGKLADLVLADAGLTADADGALVTPETLLKAADAFTRRHQETFGRAGPSTREELDLQRHWVESLLFPLALQAKVRLVVGIVEGEYLRRHHGARWQLTKSPLVADELALAAKNLFVWLHHPFDLDLVAEESAEAVSLSRSTPPSHLVSLLRRAEGRPLVLTNDLTSGTMWLQEMTDADLARGSELLRQGKAEEGERVLRAMMLRDQHRDNAHLALHVGKLLYSHDRFEALVDLMKRHARKPPLAAQKYNLLGLAQLPTNANDALGSFQTALRHDLHCGAAYLNLAQAYQKLNNRVAAAQCLRRCLQLQPQGPFARDAQRRLGELQASMTEPVGTPGGAGGADGGPP